MNSPQSPLPKRPLGRTGEELSVIGFGGIAVVGLEQPEADRLVAEAFERGCNYFDVAPTYGRGEAERKLGPALKPYRDKVFLACKTEERDRKTAAEFLRKSLRTLQTDRFDLYQIHALDSVDDIRRVLAPGGALEALLEAREQGLIRYIGFSSHSDPASLEAIESGEFDTILQGMNFICAMNNGFGMPAFKAAAKRGMGRLALKGMARTHLPKGTKREDRPFRGCWYEPLADPELANLAMRWTLAQGVTAAVTPGDAGLLRMAMNFADLETPPNEEETQRLKEAAAQTAPLFHKTVDAA